jgi:hypothetical protein
MQKPDDLRVQCFFRRKPVAGFSDLVTEFVREIVGALRSDDGRANFNPRLSLIPIT